jgi:hypothetical protein
LQRINEYKKNESLHVNRKCKNNEVNVLPVAVPRKFNKDFQAESVAINRNDHAANDVCLNNV